MDRIATAPQAQTGSEINEVQRGLAAGRCNAGRPRQTAELTSGLERHVLRGSRRLGTFPGALAVPKPLRCRQATTLLTALNLAQSTLAPGRQAAQPTPPAARRGKLDPVESKARERGIEQAAHAMPCPRHATRQTANEFTLSTRNFGPSGGIMARTTHRVPINAGHNVSGHNVAHLSTSAPVANGRGRIAAQEIPAIEAERVGMSTQRLERVAQLNQRYVDEGKVAGILTAVLRDGKLVHQSAAGSKSVADPTPLSMDAIFRVYSLSKPITSVAAMQLYEKGKFQLTDPVAKFIPEFKELTVLKGGEAVPLKTRMTMHQLLTHTAGLSYGADPNDPLDKLYAEADLWNSKNMDEFAQKVARIPLKHEPGMQWHYSVATDLLGLVVERLSGQRLDEYFNEHIFKPLDMVDTGFEVPEEKADRFLPNHIRDRDTGKVCLVPESGILQVRGSSALDDAGAARQYHDVTLFAGGAGLVSTLRDYTRFAEAVRARGVLNGTRILGSKTTNYMAMNHLPGVLKGGYSGAPLTGAGAPIQGCGFGLGYAVNVDPTKYGVIGSSSQLYWNGAAGSAFLIDPEEDLVAVSLMHLLNPWPSYPKDLRVATYQGILESRARN